MGKDEPPEDDGQPRKTARAVMGEVGTAVQNGLGPVAGRVGDAVRSGVGSVERALDDPAKSLAAEMLEKSDLPQIAGDNPLGSLTNRLDHEADFWRGVAIRQMARAAWMDRVSISSTVVLLVGVGILAAISAFRALFASEAAIAVTILLGASALLLLIGAAMIQRATMKVRQGQFEVVRDALARSDLAEARLHRLAALVEMRSSDPEGYRTALRELESEMRSG
ncbi:MAG TPA: hypothetical protein PK156_22260 [Polyangium sp.]|nr:hypothetical protein [Polyangium sp.]